MKDFLKALLANLVALAIVGGACFLLFMLFLSASIATSQPIVQVPDRAILTLNLSYPIQDEPVSEDFNSVLGEMNGNRIVTLSLRQIITSLEEAATDGRIQALYLTGNLSGTSWATVEEVRAAILKFKESSKPVIAYNIGYDEKDLFLVSVADTVLMHDDGIIEFNGLATNHLFFKNAFEKYGIDVQVTRVGKFKAAVEPYIEDEMSTPNREQNELLLNDIFTVCLDGIAKDRGADVEMLRSIADTQGILTAKEAVDLKLIDEIVYYDQVVDRLDELVGSKSRTRFTKQVNLSKYAEALELKPKKSKKDRVLVVYAEGTIVDGSSRDNLGGRDVAHLLRRARKDPKVKAVVLRVNTPGGSSFGSEEMLREARLLQEEKPFVVSMGDYAASGGYFIAAYADEIFAHPTTVTGSIGVFGMYLNFQPIMNNHGLNVSVTKTSTMADTFSTVRPKTPEELAIIQKHIDKIYEEFTEMVADARGIELARVREIAQGRVWTGTRALEFGLVDQLGSLDDAIAAAAKRASLEDYSVHQYQRSKKFAEELVEILEDRQDVISMASRPQGPMGQVYDQFMDTWETLQFFDDPTSTYMMLPYNLDIR